MEGTQYMLNPQLPVIRDDFPGNPYRDGAFLNTEEFEHPSFWQILKWQFSRNPQRKEKKKEDFAIRLQENKDFLKGDEDIIVWLGHASFYIRLSGISILTDPCLGDLPLITRRVGLPCLIEDIRPLDYILMSHGHRDHFDIPSLKTLIQHNFGVEMLVPLKMGPLLHSIGMERFQEAAWYQEYQTDDRVTLTFLPAKHWNRRGLRDFNTMLWGSFLIESYNKRIYFAGDSGYGSHFREIKQVIEDPIDVCLMPIGAYKPSFIMKHAHTNPEEAVQAFHELEGRYFVPMHYGTYDLADEPLGEPIERVRTLVSKGALNGELVELAVGEPLYLE